jgi:3-hydroxypropanoate dehydrogenase
MADTIDSAALDQLFLGARTMNKWQNKPVTDEQLHQLYDLLKLAPTSANASPGRFLFIRTPEAKEKLKPALSSGNMEKTLSAPVTVVVAYDTAFYDKLPFLFPHADAKSWFTSSPAFAEKTAFRNATLQAGYLIMAARAIGLDSGAMSGFDAAKVDAAFFEGTSWKADLLINLGYGDPAGTFGRLPRLPFEEAARIV